MRLTYIQGAMDNIGLDTCISASALCQLLARVILGEPDVSAAAEYGGADFCCFIMIAFAGIQMR